jgi:hypothetical protein
MPWAMGIDLRRGAPRIKLPTMSIGSNIVKKEAVRLNVKKGGTIKRCGDFAEFLTLDGPPALLAGQVLYSHCLNPYDHQIISEFGELKSQIRPNNLKNSLNVSLNSRRNGHFGQYNMKDNKGSAPTPE